MTDEPTGDPLTERPDDADAGTDPGTGEGAAAAETAEERERRPALERIGMAAVAVVLAILFGAVAVAAFAGGEYFLAAMGLIGATMTLVVGGATLLRG
jgi:hypothetical protein